MDKELVRQMLPHRPPEWYDDWITTEAAPDLEVEYMLFSAERLSLWPERTELTDMAKYRPIKKIWQTRCTCTICGEDFITKHIPEQGGMKGFAMYYGEDGQLYPLDPADGITPVADEIDDFGYESTIIELSELDQMECPWCGSNVTIVHRSKLRGGRTQQVLGCTVQNVGMYTTILYWLTAKRIYEDGSHTIETYPRDAYVIGERGGIQRYRHTKGSAGGFQAESRLKEWTLSGSCKDSCAVPYHDWQSINNLKADGPVCKRIPWLVGFTGEKTGITDYILGGGRYPVTYLKAWHKHRNLENLVRTGWTLLVEENFTRYVGGWDTRRLTTSVEDVDFSRKKPHEMLHMRKADFKAISEHPWGRDVFEMWTAYWYVGGKCSAVDFDRYYREFRPSGIACMLSLKEEDDQIDFPEIVKYLQKQNMDPDDLHYLMDAREMAKELYPDRELTKAELWPRNLKAVHDNLMRLQAMQTDEKKNAALNAGFQKIVDLYGHLEWTDGDLCIRLPRQNADLILEGKVLDHCVGRYGNGHVKGESVIFFVRKFRRPERSYFTLDICMTEGAPKEVQLHGYKNEHVYENYSKARKIPRKVREFVDRWKREVLMPWWLAQINTEMKEKSA